MNPIFEACKGALDDALDRFPWADRRAYGDWLAQTYYYVSHSTRLLAAAAARFPRDDRGNALHQRFAVHMGEEKRHELLALHDLKALGLSLDEFPERPVTRLFYEPQYYKIEHQDPLVLFGYIIPLEAMASGKGRWAVARVREVHGTAAATFLSLHAEDDVEHVQKAFAAIEGADPVQAKFIELNLQQSFYCYEAMLTDIARDHTRAGLPRVAE